MAVGRTYEARTGRGGAAVLAIYLGALVLPPFGTLAALGIAARGAPPRVAAALEAHAGRALGHQVVGALALLAVQGLVLGAAWRARELVAPERLDALAVALFAGDAVVCAAILVATALAGPVGLWRDGAGVGGDGAGLGRGGAGRGVAERGRPVRPSAAPRNPGARVRWTPVPADPTPSDRIDAATLAEPPPHLVYRPRPTAPARDRSVLPALVEETGGPARGPLSG